MRDYTVIGIHVTDRVKNAVDVQNLLTQYGFVIRTRLGLHDPGPSAPNTSSPGGLVLLDVVGKDDDIEALCDQLRKLHGVQVQRMFFSHPQ